MVDNSNKMPPDPQFEELGWQGWHYFKERFVDIRSDYKMYGEVVLKKRLGESIDIYKDAFENKNFVEAIRKIWETRYHYVADTLEDIITLYEKYHASGFFKSEYLLPETKKYNSGETRGNDLTFALSMELYEYIVQEAKKNYGKIFILKGSNVYEISLFYKDNNTYDKIIIKRIDVIEVK